MPDERERPRPEFTTTWQVLIKSGQIRERFRGYLSPQAENLILHLVRPTKIGPLPNHLNDAIREANRKGLRDA